jgi:hypothetical protein
MEKTFITDCGKIEVRNAMIEVDSTNLEEGIELKDEFNNIVELVGYRDIDEMSVDEVEKIFENGI